MMEPILKKISGLGVALHQRTSADHSAGDLWKADRMPLELILEVTSQTQGVSGSVQVLHRELLSENWVDLR
ncbi:hypothetical protein [Duganella caerulea]|uniref:hypothetical protein n=1 Tax=Duganella caerulea TaxID=2885762 RepID=UPI0040379F8E